MEPTSIQSSLLATATEDKIVVSQVLLDLKTLLSLTESSAKFNWGRRRRSCLEEDLPLLPKSSSRPPPIQRPRHEIEEMRLRIGAAEEKGAASSSPTTPLSFSPSESDDKSKCSKASKKRPREEYLDVIKGLSQTREVQVENVKKFYKLKAYNSELKALKQELLSPHLISGFMEPWHMMKLVRRRKMLPGKVASN